MTIFVPKIQHNKEHKAMKFISLHKIKTLITTLMAICCVCTSANAQQSSNTLSPQTDSLAQFVRNIVTYNSMFSQEKVYLHFDNTGYFMGETIWYKAYVVNPMGNRPNTLSRVLYVELLTPEGRVLQSHKVKIENGQANGQLSLKDLLHAGFYEVRAYTALMLNWPDAPIFSRVFPIFNAPETEGEDMYEDPFITPTPHSERRPDMRTSKEDKKKDNKLEKVNIQFFPEGGNLVQGVTNKVAFKVIDKQGNLLSVSGKVYNSRNEQVASAQVIHQGMGQFNLKPAEGETYYMTLEKAEVSSSEQFHLPAATSLGVAMTVDNTQDENIIVRVSRHEQMDTTQALGLTVMCRGRISHFEQIIWNDKATASLSFPKSELLEGVNQFTLFNTKGQVYADRLAFIPQKSSVHFSLSGTKKLYRPREKVEMNFKLTDSEGNPVRTMFSLAVRDADTETPTNQANGGNITANLLLGSELKGYIHDIDYYFESDDATHRQALDLLMCTQGWRRYNWEEMTHPEDFKVNYPAEEGILIRGNLTSTFRNRTKDGVDIKVYLYNGSGQTRRGSCLTDSIGQFAFLADDFNGKWIMNIQTYENEKLKEMNVNLEKAFAPENRKFATNETTLYLEDNVTQALSAQVEDSLKMYHEFGRTRWENLLPTVEVEEDREWRSEFVRKWNNMIYEMEDERMRMDDTGEEYLVEFYRWLEETNSYFTFEIDTNNNLTARYKGRPVRFMVSRVGTGGWLVENNVSIDVINLTVQDIEAIAISDKPNVEMALARYGLDSISNQDNTVVISIFVRNDYFRNREYIGVRRTKIQGFTPAIQFYLPDYSYADLPDEKDFRRTLYWAPYVTTNKQGEASVEFYNTPQCKRIKVSAETVTFGGVMGSFESIP